jgi:hypothetical protein
VYRLTERPLVRAVKYAGNRNSAPGPGSLVTLKTPDIYDGMSKKRICDHRYVEEGSTRQKSSG